jgi:hypothetical protein
MNKDEADARVAKANDLRSQLERCANIVDHNRICQEYFEVTGVDMFFPVEQYDELYDKATPEEHAEARRLYP